MSELSELADRLERLERIIDAYHRGEATKGDVIDEAHECVGEGQAAALREQAGGWISVEERLPDDTTTGVPVWVSDGISVHGGTYWDYGFHVPPELGYNVTHWMLRELPAPPQTQSPPARENNG